MGGRYVKTGNIIVTWHIVFGCINTELTAKLCFSLLYELSHRYVYIFVYLYTHTLQLNCEILYNQNERWRK